MYTEFPENKVILIVIPRFVRAFVSENRQGIQELAWALGRNKPDNWATHCDV